MSVRDGVVANVCRQDVCLWFRVHSRLAGMTHNLE